MKASHYSFFFEAEDGAHLAFNGMSGGFARIADGDRDEIKRIIADPNGYNADTGEKRNLWDSLVRGRFLIEDDVDELAMLKIRNATGRFANNGLWLTIAPTLDCNFRCPYCYEEITDGIRKETLSGERIDALLKFVGKKAKGIRSMRVDWYGGEPLLCPDTLHTLSKEFIKICKKNRCSYRVTMVTNGYFLTADMAKQLKESGLYSVQVTLDGPPEVHDKRRFLSNGEGTFDTILSNVKTAVEIINKVSIRVNIDQVNRDTYVDLFDILISNGLRDKVTIYPGRVEAEVGSCLAKNSLSSAEYMKNAKAFLKIAQDKGFKSLLTSDPKIKLESCRAVALNGWVIGPTLKLYKCWGVLGEEDLAVGHISSEGEIVANKNLTAWLTWDPFEREKCRKCKSLPICMGGCMENDIRRAAMKTTKLKDTCLELKSNVIDILRLCYNARRKAEEKGGELVDGILDRSIRAGTGR